MHECFDYRAVLVGVGDGFEYGVGVVVVDDFGYFGYGCGTCCFARHLEVFVMGGGG